VGIALRRRAVASYMRKLQYLRPWKQLSIGNVPRYTLSGRTYAFVVSGQTGSNASPPKLEPTRTNGFRWDALKATPLQPNML
jgi:hypothetical protein